MSEMAPESPTPDDAALWEQAIADENWQEVAHYEGRQSSSTTQPKARPKGILKGYIGGENPDTGEFYDF